MIRSGALRVLLPVLPGTDPARLVGMVANLAGPDGHVVFITVIPLTPGGDLPVATAAARAARRQLRGLARLLPEGVSHEELVRAAPTVVAGLQRAAGEGADLLVVPLPADVAGSLDEEPYRGLATAPLCDTIFIRPNHKSPIRSVLVAARGGPHAELALDIAQRLSRAEGASVTVLHVDVPGAEPAVRQQEQHLFRSLVAHTADAPRLRTQSVPAASVEDAVLSESQRHDVLVLGAHVGGVQGHGSLGEIPLAALETSASTVMVVKSTRPINPAIFRPLRPPVDIVVNEWFIENTTHCRDYGNLDELLAEKKRRGLSIAVALLAGASYDTLVGHARVLLEELSQHVPLLDEVILFGGSDAEMQEAAAAAGLPAYIVAGAQPDQRGRLLHASLRILKSDIVIWIDGDIRNPHPKLVYGLAGPLILNDKLQYVKGFHGLPPQAPDADLRSLVGEFTARPLLNLFFAELSGLIDPLGVEHAIRRIPALDLPIFTGAAAELGLLIDVYERFGLRAISQVALDERMAATIDVALASRQAFAAVQVVVNRLGRTGEAPVHERMTPTLKLLHQREGRFEIDVVEAHEREQGP